MPRNRLQAEGRREAKQRHCSIRCFNKLRTCMISYQRSTHGRFQVVTTDEGWKRVALPYLTANRYAPSGSWMPFAIPSGVSLVGAAAPLVGQMKKATNGNRQRILVGSKGRIVIGLAGAARTGERRKRESKAKESATILREKSRRTRAADHKEIDTTAIHADFIALEVRKTTAWIPDKITSLGKFNGLVPFLSKGRLVLEEISKVQLSSFD